MYNELAWLVSMSGMNFRQVFAVSWSPENAVDLRDPIIATLNVSHWVRIFGRNQKWFPVLDVTKMWHEYLKAANWSLECKVKFENIENPKMVTLVRALNHCSNFFLSMCGVVEAHGWWTRKPKVWFKLPTFYFRRACRFKFFCSWYLNESWN